jgi:hypothetical protein
MNDYLPDIRARLIDVVRARIRAYVVPMTLVGSRGDFHAQVGAAARERADVRRLLRKVVNLEQKLSSTVTAEAKRIVRNLSFEEVMNLDDSTTRTAVSESVSQRITRITEERDRACKEAAATVAPSAEGANLAAWIAENNEQLIASLPRRSWWQVLIGQH